MHWLILLAALWLGAGCAIDQSADGHRHATREGAPPLYEGLGTLQQTITTQSPQAQAYFNQGLRLLYAFNHLEAQRSFREAAHLDPSCAMCYWGIALTYGANYNSPTDAEREKGALEAVRKAVALGDRVTAREWANIDALTKRHSADPNADRVALARAYAAAMREVAHRFPEDLDAGTLAADAMMNLRPWNLWKPDGTPQEGTREILSLLESVLRADKNHPGALHLYIHAVEASPNPARAEAAADRLSRLMPAAGHIVHMPAHIYWRIGRYADAAESNVKAVAADRAYFKLAKPSDIYQMLYHPHNLEFIWLSASMEGRSVESVRAAREFASAAPVDMVMKIPDMESAPAAPIFALARFAQWEEILRLAAPRAELLWVTGAWRYARGLAYASTKRPGEAERELAELKALTARVPKERTVAGFFKTAEMLELAGLVLQGELAARGGKPAAAVEPLTRAVGIQDGHWFTEPPPWYFPTRQALGAVLLQAGRPAEAEAVFRDDLLRNPRNGWSLFGLAQALRAQEGRRAEAEYVDIQFRRAWDRADIRLTAARL
jgi:tetratricopeptide (TPR) repeat protein